MLKWLLREGQIDSGMWQGAIMLGGVVGGTYTASNEQCTGFISLMIATYRACGLKEALISDVVLVEDFIRKNVLAACNVLMASPVFYFAFAKIMNEGFVVSAIRGISGTLRIVPFMGFFYGFFAVVCPFVTQYFMESHGQDYAEASGTASIVVMLSGFVFIEALVELRGVGVTFAQMTLGSFLLFIPALIGRLATGVLTQQQKVEQAPPESPYPLHLPFISLASPLHLPCISPASPQVGQTTHESLLPEDWNDGSAPTWQQHTHGGGHCISHVSPHTHGSGHFWSGDSAR